MRRRAVLSFALLLVFILGWEDGKEAGADQSEHLELGKVTSRRCFSSAGRGQRQGRQ